MSVSFGKEAEDQARHEMVWRALLSSCPVRFSRSNLT
jgi:hypothetical protein